MQNAHKYVRKGGKIGSSATPKKAVNVSIDRALLDRARDSDLNLSSILESALTDTLEQAARDRWVADNRASIRAYNEEVEKHGVFSDGLRPF
jgi:antitoxin CcdA